MPRGNRTGPEGRGPLTGRGAGYCAGYEEPGFTSSGVGRGGGMGRGRGGAGNGFGFGRRGRRGYRPTFAQNVDGDRILDRLDQFQSDLADLNRQVQQWVADRSRQEDSR